MCGHLAHESRADWNGQSESQEKGGRCNLHPSFPPSFPPTLNFPRYPSVPSLPPILTSTNRWPLVLVRVLTLGPPACRYDDDEERIPSQGKLLPQPPLSPLPLTPASPQPPPSPPPPSLPPSHSPILLTPFHLSSPPALSDLPKPGPKKPTPSLPPSLPPPPSNPKGSLAAVRSVASESAKERRDGAGSREWTEAPSPSREEVEAMHCVERSSSGTRTWGSEETRGSVEGEAKEGGMSTARSPRW